MGVIESFIESYTHSWARRMIFYPQSFAQVMLSNMTGTCIGFARCALNNGRAGVVRKRSACKSVFLVTPGGGKSQTPRGGKSTRQVGRFIGRTKGCGACEPKAQGR